jgi:hypothetical protein
MTRMWNIIWTKLAYEQQTIFSELERLINLNESTEELAEKINLALERLVIVETKIAKWGKLKPQTQIEQNDGGTNNQ